MDRKIKDTDGKCFASVGSGKGCLVLSAQSAGCDSYSCPFYKPEEYASWVRIDCGESVRLVSPGEYYRKR